MITDADIDKLKAVFATKDDFDRFPTKEDLKEFATKEDLKGFATKDDILAMERSIRADMATKDDLKRFATKDDLLEMEHRMTKTIVDAVVDVYDYLARQDEEIKPMKREQRGQRVAIGDLESRVQTLESART